MFACNVAVSFLYIFAEFFGAAMAAGLAIFMYGRAPVGRVSVVFRASVCVGLRSVCTRSGTAAGPAQVPVVMKC